MESVSGLSDDDDRDDGDDRDNDDDVMMIMMVIITLLVGNPCHPESVARRQRTTIRNPGAHALLLLCLKTLFKFLIINLGESASGRFCSFIQVSKRRVGSTPGSQFTPHQLFHHRDARPQVIRDVIQAQYKKTGK